ncbi:hypothetical protein [Halobellus rubicundus]|uniref:Uncharacterized protein n=1 Tax=Halobellus rubicundus TaxID=2996466 RepID=A0ABD5M905_9EURY
MSDESETEIKTREEILDEATREADYKSNTAQLGEVNNDLTRTQIHQQQRLEQEIEALRISLEKFTFWSRALTFILIILGVASLLAQINVI